MLSTKCTLLRKVLSLRKCALPYKYFHFPYTSALYRVLSSSRSALPKVLSYKKCSPPRKMLSSRWFPIKKYSFQSALHLKSAVLKELSSQKMLSLKHSPYMVQGESTRRYYDGQHLIHLNFIYEIHFQITNRNKLKSLKLAIDLLPI